MWWLLTLSHLFFCLALQLSSSLETFHTTQLVYLLSSNILSIVLSIAGNIYLDSAISMLA